MREHCKHGLEGPPLLSTPSVTVCSFPFLAILPSFTHSIHVAVCQVHTWLCRAEMLALPPLKSGCAPSGLGKLSFLRD